LAGERVKGSENEREDDVEGGGASGREGEGWRASARTKGLVAPTAAVVVAVEGRRQSASRGWNVVVVVVVVVIIVAFRFSRGLPGVVGELY
jgi:hypothetical protein